MAAKDVRGSIVQSAGMFFARFGFAKTTMDEVARHIHKAKGVIYYYFNSKEELFREVLRKELGQIQAELGSIVLAETDPLEMLRQYFFRRMELMQQAPNYHETLKADLFDKFEFVKEVREAFEQFERIQLRHILDQCKEAGYISINDIPTTVNIIMVVIHSTEIPLYVQGKYEEYKPTLLELADMIVNSLRKNKT
ncbi:MAG: TetR family transcriptional regulator [Bacteroidetes bacterium]|nr:TetR family transcriptional regulator [Bacteroidota bacterium]